MAGTPRQLTPPVLRLPEGFFILLGDFGMTLRKIETTEVVDPKTYIAGLPEHDKIKAALMYLVLKYGMQGGHWSGHAENLADALWDTQAGLYGADIDLPVYALAPMFDWCDLRVAVENDNLRVSVVSTVV
jgi:hypothetical protein